MPTTYARALTALTCLLVVACSEVESNAGMDAGTGADLGSQVLACPRNWTRGRDNEPYGPHIHVVDGALVMEPSATELSVQTQVTSEDSGGNVMRFEFSHFLLGPGAEFELAFHSQELAQATITVTDAGARLTYAPEIGGLEFTLPFVSSPTRATIEFHQTDEGLRTYAYFFGAGDDQVLTGVAAHGSVFVHLGYIEMKSIGITSLFALERYVNYEQVSGTGYADELDCDGLAEPNLLGWTTMQYVALGTACSSDRECSAGDACVDGKCRRPCFSSLVCGNEVCMAHPNGGGYCRLESESRCASGVCPDGLVCGVDSQCRRPCEGGREAYSTDYSTVAGTCGLNYVSCDFGDTCVETSKFRCVHGACADDDEVGAAEAGGWGCGYGAVRCSTDSHRIEQCNVNGPGFQEIEHCGEFSDSCSYVCEGPDTHDYLCATDTTSTEPRCSPCRHVCEGGEDVLDLCSDAPGHVAVDCETGFSWCSFGPGGDIARMHPGDLPYFEAECESVIAPTSAPEPVAITPAEGSTVTPFHIDRTEVSRAEYVAFLQSRPTPHDVPSACAYNVSLLPGFGTNLGDWPWFERPDRPAMVDWCDAWSYCQWAGGHLCGEHGGGNVASADVADPAHGAWPFVCTVGGTSAEPYGPTRDDSVCDAVGFPYSDVGTHAGCTSAVSGFAGVMDQPGNAPEWIDSCIAGAAVDGSTDPCVRMFGADCASHESVARSIAGAAIRCCYE